MKTNEEIAKEVIAGKWGNGQERRKLIEQLGYNYNDIQKIVNNLLKQKKNITDVPLYTWDFLIARIKNPYGVAGLMGNLKAESNLNPKNMQNSYEKKLGMNDETYTKAVDNGKYNNFCNDLVGYGIAQWTSTGRKTALYNSRNGRSIGDLDLQLEFLWKELNTSYKGVLNGLKVADSVRSASDLVLTKFERPKDQSENVQIKRALYGQEFYEKFK